MFLIRLFSTGNNIRHSHHGKRIFVIGSGGTDRFETILESRIQSRDCELIRRRVIRQSGNGEHVVAWKFIDQMRNPRDITRLSASFLTCNRVDNIWSRTRRYNDRAIPWDRFIKFGVACVKGESRRNHLAIFFHDLARKFNPLTFHKTSVLCKNITCRFITNL